MDTKRFTLALGLLMALVCPAFATDVLIKLTDARLQSSGYTNRTIYLYPMSMPTVASPSVVLGAKIIGVTDANGEWLLSPLKKGLYRADVQAPPVKETFMFLVESDDLGAINAADKLVANNSATFPAGNVSWAAAVTDSRYALKGEAGGGSPWAMSGNTIYPSGSTASGGGWTVAGNTIYPQ